MEMPKIAIITCEVFYEAYEIPPGCYENGNLIIFSGHFGRSLYREVPGFLLGQEDMFDEAYVYWGNDEGDEEALISFLMRAGKKVHVVSCGCSRRAKQLADEHSLEFLHCSCGNNSQLFFIELIEHLA